MIAALGPAVRMNNSMGLAEGLNRIHAVLELLLIAQFGSVGAQLAGQLLEDGASPAEVLDLVTAALAEVAS